GHSVRVCPNGREAVEAVRQEPFDLVVMDIQMPVMDGYEATAAIREWEAGSGMRLPILALTARALKGDRERCLAAGMDGYVTKPIRPQTLLGAIAEFFDAPVGGRAEERPPEPPVERPEEFDFAAALDFVDGDIELLREMAVVFLEEAPRLVSSVEAAIESRDAGSLERAAHALKGTVGSFAAKKAYEAARLVEDAARAGRADDAAEAAIALREEMGRLIPSLAALPSRIEDPQPAGG
ncbi:MAG: sensor histidine kinase, partial [Candidatus Latescibacterota bacterium]